MEAIEKYYRQKNVNTLMDASNEKKVEGVNKILKGATRCAVVGASVGLTVAGVLGGWAWLTVPLTILLGPGQVKKGINEITSESKAKFRESKELKGIAQDSNKLLKRDMAKENEAKESLKSNEPLKMATTTEISIAPENKRESTNSYVS